MNIHRRSAYFMVLGVLLLLVLVLGLSPDVRLQTQADVFDQLPSKVGEFTGVDLSFCQNEQCMRVFRVGAWGSVSNCLTCDQSMDSVSLAENRLLPQDTDIRKKVYVGSDGEEFHVSIVMTGKERRSIHKPQVCLAAQGHTIVKQRVIQTTSGDNETLGIMLLDLNGAPTGELTPSYQDTSSFAYWFVGGGHVTPYHMERLLYMFQDRVFRNVNHRWAYISVSTARKRNSSDLVDRIKYFVSQLNPLISRDQLAQNTK